jgi:N-acetylmuramoyl-L-alanine amidase
MKICVDPGHGMSNATNGIFDSGATAVNDGTTFREADITLSYGMSLKAELDARNVERFMTRTNNTDPAPVGTRASRAEATGCDVFVAFHLNANDSEQAHGLEVLYGNRENKAFATTMQNQLVGVTGLRDRGVVIRPNLAVLKFHGPAVLIELGFITNNSDRTSLLKSELRHAVCKAVADVALAQQAQV